MTKIIVVDLGGVYFDDGTSIAIEKVHRLLGVPKEKVEEVLKSSPKKEGWLYRLGKITLDEFTEAGAKKLGVDRERFLELVDLWNSSYSEIKGMSDFVSKLRKNYKVIVFSQIPKGRFEYLDKKYSLQERFDDFALSFEAGFGKEDVRFYEFMLKKAKCTPSEVLLIDDRQQFLDTAKSLGMQTVLFSNPGQLKADLKKAGIKV